MSRTSASTQLLIEFYNYSTDKPVVMKYKVDPVIVPTVNNEIAQTVRGHNQTISVGI